MTSTFFCTFDQYIHFEWKSNMKILWSRKWTVCVSKANAVGYFGKSLIFPNLGPSPKKRLYTHFARSIIFQRNFAWNFYSSKISPNLKKNLQNSWYQNKNLQQVSVTHVFILPKHLISVEVMRKVRSLNNS